jgi:GNAT superfamily N-acetyltransferase
MPIGARLARTDDVDAISAITLAVFVERLGTTAPEDALAHLDARAFADTWAQAILSPPSPLYRLAVAVGESDQVHGYAAWGPSADADAGAGDVDIVAFEISPEHRRQGHGSRLMSAVVDLSGNAGALGLTMWCHARDEGRRAFLQSCGWAPDAAWREIEITPGLVQREVRLVTSLT